MNYGNLYQYKTLYHIYRAGDRTFHIEGFPIVYMNDYLILFKRPGTKGVCQLSKRYYDWTIHFNEEEKERLKNQLILDQNTEGFYLDVNVYDAKQFCKELNTISQDDPEVLREKLKSKKAELEARERNFKENTKNLRSEIEEIEEKLKDKEGSLISNATSLE